ncbi:MAG: hypothetical protein H7Y30_11550 [Pyrinomonadaceae bacterium]|nr:hypothetical protein [Pyrinomonadaceae bacterium]
MQSQNQDKARVSIEARYRILLILWFAILNSVALFFGMTLFIPRPEAAEANSILALTLTGVGILTAIVSFVVKKKLLEQAAEKQQPTQVQSAYIIAFALSEVASLFGLLMYMITAERYYYLMFIVSAVCMLAHFPRREHLLATVFKNQR